MRLCFRLIRFGPVIMIGMMSGCALEQSAGGRADDPESGEKPTAIIRSIDVDPDAEEPRKLFGDQAKAGNSSELVEQVVERGTGRLIGDAKPSAAATVSRNDAGDMMLNVVEADIREVVRLVLEDGLGANYAIDPEVTGTITIRTSSPIPAADLVPILDSVLNLNGATLVEQGGLYKIIPLDQAAVAGGKVGTRAVAATDQPGSGIQVVPLRYADPLQLAELLSPFVGGLAGTDAEPSRASGGGSGFIQVDPVRNALLLVGTADQIATMNDLIDMFDVDWMAGMSFGLYPLKAVLPSQLTDELDQLFADPESGITTGALRFVPIDRLSALLVITAQPDYLTRVESWIRRLDKRGEGEDGQIYVYPVQNGRASDLALVLGELFDIRSSAIGGESLLAPGQEAIELRSAFPGFASGNRDELQDAEGKSRDGIKAGSLRDRERQVSGSGSSIRHELAPGRDDTGTRVVAHAANNALLIRTSAEEYREIESALAELDKLPLQVLLEATIAEVTLKDDLRYGVQWFFGSDKQNGATFSALREGVTGPVFPGFSGLLSRGDVRVVIDALDQVTDIKVLSSPQVMVLDNEPAFLEVGDEVPIITKQSERFDDDARVINNVEQRQTGVILTVTPRVNSSGLVILDIQQEVSNVVNTTTSGIDSPTIAQRRIGTTVVVDSDQTIALGGLIQDKVDEVDRGVPYLMDIPILGALFRATSTITTRTELLVLLTPKVVANQHEAVAVTRELRERLRAIEPLNARVLGMKQNPDAEAATIGKGDVAPSN